jgi:hypothetical protein
VTDQGVFLVRSSAHHPIVDGSEPRTGALRGVRAEFAAAVLRLLPWSPVHGARKTRSREATVQTPDLLNRYGDIATYLGLDLVAIFLMTYVLYFRRHWRADLLLSYIALNIGIFVTMSLLTQVRVDLAVGFGLFAILSIIRLRSSAVTQQEVAYYFLALVLGLVNGLGVPDRGLVVAMNAVVLLAMLAVDSKPLRDRSQRMDVHLDGVYTNEAALVAELDRKLGGRVAYQEITEIDLIHGHMLVDVRLQPGQGVVEPPPQKSHHHAGDGATPAPGSDPADNGGAAAGSSIVGRHDDEVRQGVGPS